MPLEPDKALQHAVGGEDGRAVNSAELHDLATLIADEAAAAIRKLKAEQAGVIEVAGPELAHSLAAPA